MITPLTGWAKLYDYIRELEADKAELIETLLSIAAHDGVALYASVSDRVHAMLAKHREETP